MVLKAKPKRKKTQTLPAYVVYEEIDGKALPYKGFKEVLAKTKKIEDIMGSSALQGVIVFLINWFLGNNLDRKKYWISTNEAGINLGHGNNLANDIMIFPKQGNPLLGAGYLKFAPKVAIEVDTKIEFDEETYDKSQDYLIHKSQKLIDFGCQKVIWILTDSRKIFVAVPDQPWTIVDFNADIPVLDGCVLNLAKLLAEEGVEF